MQGNYCVWDIDIEEFYRQKTDRERAAFLVRFAVLAPSSHNAQPWKFLVLGNAILVMLEKNRALPVSDANERHAHIALGCAIENICIAADYYGYRAHVTYFPADTQEAVAKITFEEMRERSPNASHLIFAIPKRRSNRNPFTNQLPPEKLLERWRRYASESLHVDIITDRAQRAALAGILVGFREKIFDNVAFRRELATYKRTNLTHDYVGMPGFTMGFSTPFSLIAPFLIRHFNVVKLTRGKDLNVLTGHTPVFIFLSTKEDTKIAWLDTGRVFQRMLLQAEHEGLQTSISAIPHPSRELQTVLGTLFYPQIFFRAGYTERVSEHSPRLLATSCIEVA